MVIQNLQEYLKYLILTTSVEPATNPPVCFGLCSAEQPVQQHHEAAAVMEEEKHTSEEPEEDSADLSADEEAARHPPRERACTRHHRIGQP